MVDNVKFSLAYHCLTAIGSLIIGAKSCPFLQISEQMTLRCPSLIKFTGL